MEVEIKKEKLSTLETQDLIYRKYVEDYKLQHGKSFEELIALANEPKDVTTKSGRECAKK
jgi:hypothetical protein